MRSKRLLAHDSDNPEAVCHVQVRSRKTEEGNVLRDPFSNFHIRGHHYSINEIQLGIEGGAHIASRSTVERWSKRYGTLFNIVLQSLQAILGTKRHTAKNILDEFLNSDENWLNTLLSLFFHDETMQNCVNFGHDRIRKGPYFSRRNTIPPYSGPELVEDGEEGG